MEEQLIVAPAKRSIYNIQSDYLQLMQQIEDADGELSAELSEALAINEKELTTKAVNYSYIIKEYKEEADKAQREIDRITKLKVRAEKNAEELQNRISEAMQKFGIDKVESNFVKLYFKPSKTLVIGTDAKIPSGYMKSKEVETIDKAGLKKAIEQGAEFEGIWIQEKKNLQIV